MNTLPNPLVSCAKCLWLIGLGYDRISRVLFGSASQKHRIYKWKKYHSWPNHHEPFQTYLKYRRMVKPPTDYKPLSESERASRQQARFNKRTKRSLRIYLCTTINQNIKFGLYPKSVERLVGCSRLHLMAHLQSLFQPEMNWNNYGSYWEIDHIKAIHHFNIHNPEQRKTCFHFSNLQPLTRHQNRKKHTKLHF